MEGEAGDPYRRPARRTQWLLSALAHHYGLDRGVENEIVVLATGLDQYLQEVFHHLDCRGAGRLPRADFRALCAVLGLNADGEVNTEDANSAEEAAKNQAAGIVAGGDADVREEARLALRADPPELTFRQFHARLCGYFSTRAGPRLPRGALSEHIETQIRLRRPRRRRRRPGSPSLHSGANGERVAHLEEENSSLRELVEDLRAALQSSDARCLALQVGLWKSQSDIPEAAAHKLQRAQGALAEAEARARRLQRGQVEVRLRTEEARQAVRRSLHRVRELEALARRVPRMQRQVQRLEAELRRYRSERPQLLNSSQASVQPGDKNGDPMTRGTRGEDTNPGGTQQPDTSLRSRDTDEEEEQLFRSVEGQAASEEEEEDRWQEKSRPPQAHAQVPLVQPSGCVSRCGERTAEMLKTSFGHCDDADHICTLELETRVTKLGEQLQALGCSGKTLGTPEEAELQQMETEHLRLELQMVETERVRLSLLEEKLVDVLQLLQRLRDLRVHMALWPSWTPCTKPWLAVSSCREIPQHQRPQLGHTRTPSSSPVELPGPVMGHHGHSNHHQTSLDHNQTCFHGQSDHHGTNTGSYWTNLHSQTDRHQSSLLSHPQYCQSSLHGQPGHCWTVFHRLNILHKWFDCCHFLRTLAAKAPSQTGSSSYSSLGPLTFSQNPHTETLQL